MENNNNNVKDNNNSPVVDTTANNTAVVTQSIASPDQVAALFNQTIFPQAGPPAAPPDSDTSPSVVDDLTQTISQPLQANAPAQGDGKPASTTVAIVSGLVNRLKAPDSVNLPQGVTPTGRDFSNWGNEALW